MSANIADVDDNEFDQEVIGSEIPVLVDFWATWCAPCRALAPVLQDVADAYQGKVKFLKMDVEHNQLTPPRFNIRGIPALILYKDGKAVATKVGGNLSKAELSSFLDENI